MKEYESPSVELIEFEDEVLMATSKKYCNCYAERWTEAEDWSSVAECELLTGSWEEIAYAEAGPF